MAPAKAATRPAALHSVVASANGKSGTPATKVMLPVSPQPVIVSRNSGSLSQPVIVSKSSGVLAQPVIVSQNSASLAQPVIVSQNSASLVQPVIASRSSESFGVQQDGSFVTCKSSPSLDLGTPVSASTAAPTWASPRGGATPAGAFTPSAGEVAASPRAATFQVRVPLRPASITIPGVMPHGVVPQTGTPQSASAASPLPPTATLSAQVGAAPGFTPLAKRASFGERPSLGRRASFEVVTPTSASPATILRTYGLAPGMPYPPGMGFTPVAAQLSKVHVGSLQRKASFGFSRNSSLPGSDSMPETGSDDEPQPQRLDKVEEKSPLSPMLEAGESPTSADGQEDVFSRELLLFYSQACPRRGDAQLTPEEAGFALPQPGWLRSEKAESSAAPAAPALQAKHQAKAQAKPQVVPLQQVAAAPAQQGKQYWQPSVGAQQAQHGQWQGKQSGSYWQQHQQQAGAAEWWKQQQNQQWYGYNKGTWTTYAANGHVYQQGVQQKGKGHGKNAEHHGPR